MSYRYVRDMLRGWATTEFAARGVPFFNSIDQIITPPHDSIWATVEFDPAADTLLDFCGAHLATGLADFIFCGPPNVGDTAVLQAADNCIFYLMQRRDASGALTLAYAHQPEEFSNGTADHNYRVYVAVEYRFVFVPPKPPLTLERESHHAGRN